MSRPTFANIDTRAFVANYRYAKSLAPGAGALAVVKADAYGHGAVPLTRSLGAEADGFAVACTEEAMELRESGIDRPILLLEGVFEPSELINAALHELMIVVHSDRQLEWLAASRLARPLRVWLKIDSGMHRLGFAPRRVPGVHAQLAALEQVSDIVLMSHFACADETGNRFTSDQLSGFNDAVGGIAAPLCLANSAAIMAWPQTRAQWVRPGIMLYGSSPLSDGGVLDRRLEPVMQLESRLIAIHNLNPGDAIGYGRRFVCDRETRVGVVAIGYADGYPRHAPDGTPVVIGGRRTRLIGRVSMDMLTIDLTPLGRGARVGDAVELWGKQVSAAEVARNSGTIAYELFTGVNRRVHYRYR